jgi:site-specific DNA recombinase
LQRFAEGSFRSYLSSGVLRAGIYRKKVERLTEALNNPEDRNEAAEAIRALVEKITLRPGPNRGEIDATLHGELGTILGWIEAQVIGKLGNAKLPQSSLRECRYRWLRG